MKLIITGGCGFIGSNLVRLCINAGHHVLNVDALTYAGNQASLTDISNHSNYQFLHADITDASRLSAAINDFQPDAVIHLAAESHVDRSIDGPEQFIQTNIVGTYHLLQASRSYYEQLPKNRAKAFRFLHVSTDEVYGSLGDTGLFEETTPYSPHSPYSASKASSDHLARAWADTYGLPILVTNCSNNYGPFQFPEKLIPVVILKCLQGQPIPVYGEGLNVRDWLYVEDHAKALLMVTEIGRPGQTYNIGGNNEQTNIDLVRRICRTLDELRPRDQNVHYEDLITFVTDRPGHDLRYAIDASKIKRDLGWEPLESSETGFRKTVQWYLENEMWWQDILSGDYKLDRLGKGEQHFTSRTK